MNYNKAAVDRFVQQLQHIDDRNAFQYSLTCFDQQYFVIYLRLYDTYAPYNYQAQSAVSDLYQNPNTAIPKL